MQAAPLLAIPLLLAAGRAVAEPAGCRPEGAELPTEIAEELVQLGGNLAERKAASARLETRGAEVVPVLLDVLEHPRWMCRWDAVNVLGQIGDAAATEGLARRVLEDPNPHVRWRALWALAVTDREGERARPLFRESLSHDDPARRWHAAVGLGMYRDPSCLPAVHEALSSEDWWVRWEAVNTLGRIHAPGSSRRLGPLISDDDRKAVRREAVFVLGAVCDPPARRLLADALSFEDPGLRWRAAMGLGRCGSRDDLEALRARLTVERDPTVRERIEGAIERLEADPAWQRPASTRTEAPGSS